MPRFDASNYIPVQQRIVAFWERFPEGRILTALCSDPDQWEICRYRAEVYRDADDTRPAAVGYAFERAGGISANQFSHEENCESSAIGRALANLGFATTHENRPSREEMEKVNRMHDEIEQHRQSAPAPRPAAASTLPVTRKQGLRTPDLVAILNERYGYDLPADARAGDVLRAVEEKYGSEVPSEGVDDDGRPRRFPSTVLKHVEAEEAELKLQQ